MPSNPFKRSESPRDRFDKARRGVATTARGVRDGADRVARALDDSDEEKRGRSGPRLAVGSAAVLGAAYVGAKRLGLMSGRAKQSDEVPAGGAESAGGANRAPESASPPPAGATATGAAAGPLDS
jgi:hypothetical protein